MGIFSRIQIVERVRPSCVGRRMSDPQTGTVVEYAVRRRFWIPFTEDTYVDLKLASIRWRPEHDSDAWTKDINKANYFYGRATRNHSRALSKTEVKAMVELEK